jgi:hypothetical protein
MLRLTVGSLQCTRTDLFASKWRPTTGVFISCGRFYGSTSILNDDTASAADAKKLKDEAFQKKLEAKLAARDYNNRRAAYKRQVSVLRKEYADEIEKQRLADKILEEQQRAKLTRMRLERQRKKNMRSAFNALREEQLRKQREREFKEHLELQQRIRDAKHDRYTAARQMVIDELEKESPLWLTTTEEVEAAFSNPDINQLLWSRPGMVLGATNPSIDSHYWQYETHTYKMEKTYVSQRQELLERMEAVAYDNANIDQTYWTTERIQAQEKLEQKAKLRAMVYTAGRAELLKKQRELIQDDSKHDLLPTAVKVPSLNVLNNDAAVEREGARILMNDPTKFFVFENESLGSENRNASSSLYTGPTLGAPIALRDPLRDGPDGTVFPEIIGKYPKPDTRTEREKKLAEREEKMWAAAQVEAQKELDAAGTAGAEYEDDDDDEDGIDYDEVEENDPDDEEWARGLDPETDNAILQTPREFRYSEEDIDWVLAKLNDKLQFFSQQFAQDVEIIKEEFKMDLRQKAAATSEQQSSSEGQSTGTTTQMDVVPEGSFEAALLALPEKQLLALSDLEESYEPGSMADYELAAAIKEIPGLTEEQIMFILNRDRTI